jgi:hypothetical protein
MNIPSSTYSPTSSGLMAAGTSMSNDMSQLDGIGHADTIGSIDG